MYRSGTIPNVVFVDPPRIGLDRDTIKTLLEIVPEKIIYISCNPESLADNLDILKEKYEIGNVQPFDMFPFTNHVECVCVLECK
ncbi:putative RNA methyltransferase [compost metagenome]